MIDHTYPEKPKWNTDYEGMPSSNMFEENAHESAKCELFDGMLFFWIYGSMSMPKAQTCIFEYDQDQGQELCERGMMYGWANSGEMKKHSVQVCIGKTRLKASAFVYMMVYTDMH